MKGISFDEKSGLRIGSLTTLAEIEASDAIKKTYAPLWDAVNVMASAQVRTIATIGGNLCTPPVGRYRRSAHRARASVQVSGPKGDRTIPIEDFFTGPKACACGTEEIVTAVMVPKPAPLSGAAT